MAKIVLSTFGSLGDLHPKIALGIELKRRGHEVVFNVMEFYREKIESLGFEFSPLRPDIDPDNRELARQLMDTKTGTEKIIKEIIMPNLRPMFEDMMRAVKNADLLITGEIVYPAKSVVEKSGVKWISTSLAPISFLSADDPPLPPVAEWYKYLRFMPTAFHRGVFNIMRGTIKNWYEPYKNFRRELSLDEDHDPIFDDKYSDVLHLAMFSKVLGVPQPDWHSPTLQTGFCFYDSWENSDKTSEELQKFLDAGEPPIVFTLGSAAVMDARDFFEESAKAARILNRRAVLLYGIFNEPPEIVESRESGVESREKSFSDIAMFDYAPYSEVFPRAACVVHQGGVGTTGQVLRAGVLALIMPFSHDQPDNAARCKRAGVAEIIDRERYTAAAAAKKLENILNQASYKSNAFEASRIVKAERGTATACDAIEKVLENEKLR
ncbi:glycosyltransferase [soil metagenome]